MPVLLLDVGPIIETAVAAAVTAADDDDDETAAAAAAAAVAADVKFCGATVLMYLRLSLCDLYSIGVFGGKFNTRRSVSRIRVVQL